MHVSDKVLCTRHAQALASVLLPDEPSFLAADGRLLEISANSFIQWIMERFRFSIGAYNPEVYSNEMQTNTDYCKFDDVLRMVLDCTPAQVSDIRVILDYMHATGDVDFGFFETEQALITCLLFDLNSSQHLHFIDGDNGGFCSASLEYKQQLASH
ncbi:MAG: hypothetical protein ACI82O_004340 [Patiriisocius sp.]|jgi:hypothetical protein